MNESAEHLRAELAAARLELDTVLSDLVEERAARDVANARTEDARREAHEALVAIRSALVAIANDDIESARYVLRLAAGETTE